MQYANESLFDAAYTHPYIAHMTIGNRLDEAMQLAGFDSQSALARASGVPQPTINRILKGVGKKGPEAETLRKLALACRVTFEWLYEGIGAPQRPSTSTTTLQLTDHPHRRAADFELVSADQTDAEVGEIEYWNAKGSCGGGVLNFEDIPKGRLVKESTFFSKYSVRPSNLFAIYADGNSMADFIVDGDIVIFDKSRRTPISGEIFLIEHPDGLRIKQLRREIDGTWVLESRNADKRRYPDERIDPGQEALLKILGQFVYRQGG